MTISELSCRSQSSNCSLVVYNVCQCFPCIHCFVTKLFFKNNSSIRFLSINQIWIIYLSVAPLDKLIWVKYHMSLGSESHILCKVTRYKYMTTLWGSISLDTKSRWNLKLFNSVYSVQCSSVQSAVNIFPQKNKTCVTVYY